MKALRVLFHFIAVVAAASLVTAVLLHLRGGRDSDKLSPGQVKAYENLVADYLDAHPEAIAKAIDQLQEHERTASRDAARKVIHDKSDAIFHDPGDLILGNANGDVTIVEFFDYRCPYCKHAVPGIMDALKSDGRVRLVLKEFPILGAESVLASRAALASAKQGKYAAFHMALLTSASALDETSIMEIARGLGIDTERLAADMKDPAIDALIKKNHGLAEALGIDGTPVFIVGDELVPGAVDRHGLEALVKQARGKS